MLLASSLLTAFSLCTPIAAAVPPSERLAVSVNVAFDRSISSRGVKAAVIREAALIWKGYGVDLIFGDRTVPAALALDVVVERQAPHGDDTPAVLGHTSIAPAPRAPAPIRISFDAIDALLERRHGGSPQMHDYVLATALGRVLAHEIGHVLLGVPAYHDVDGLMRTTFFPDDLARPERSRFQLAEHSVVRLRSRIVSLTEAQAAGCGRAEH